MVDVDETEPSIADLLGRVAVRLRQGMATGDTEEFGGLTPHQARIVGYIEANEGRGLIQRDIAELTGTRPASVSSLLQGLERDGWIERRTDPADSRRKTLHATDKAADMVRRFESRTWAGADAMIGGLTADEQRILVRLLVKLDRHLGENS